MLSFQIVFIVTVALTVASGVTATSIVVFGDTPLEEADNPMVRGPIKQTN